MTAHVLLRRRLWWWRPRPERVQPAEDARVALVRETSREVWRAHTAAAVRHSERILSAVAARRTIEQAQRGGFLSDADARLLLSGVDEVLTRVAAALVLGGPVEERVPA